MDGKYVILAESEIKRIVKQIKQYKLTPNHANYICVRIGIGKLMKNKKGHTSTYESEVF